MNGERATTTRAALDTAGYRPASSDTAARRGGRCGRKRRAAHGPIHLGGLRTYLLDVLATLGDCTQYGQPPRGFERARDRPSALPFARGRGAVGSTETRERAVGEAGSRGADVELRGCSVDNSALCRILAEDVAGCLPGRYGTNATDGRVVVRHSSSIGCAAEWRTHTRRVRESALNRRARVARDVRAVKSDSA